MAQLERVHARTGLIAESDQTEKSSLIGNIDRLGSAKRAATSGRGEHRKKFRNCSYMHREVTQADRWTVNTLFCQHWMLFSAIAIKTQQSTTALDGAELYLLVPTGH